MPKSTAFMSCVLLLGSLTAGGCGPDVPDAWAAYVPKDQLTMAFGDETSGNVKKVALNYKKEGMSGNDLRGKIGALIEKDGFSNIVVCESENGTSSAIFVNDGKEVFQVTVNLLGEEMYDVGLERATGLPGVELADEKDCKFTDAAAKVCKIDGKRCKFE